MISGVADFRHALRLPSRRRRDNAEACFADDEFTRVGSHLVDYLARRRAFDEVAEPGCLLAPDAAIGSVVGIDDSREKDWKLPAPEKVEERDRGAHRLLDVAAAEDLWIGAALTKSTIRSAGDFPKPVLWPNCCLG